jgi:hypothetical protein
MTIVDAREILAIPDSVSDEQVQFALSAAANRVKRDGVSETHIDYDALLIFAIGSFLVSRGTLRNGVKSEKVADISISYGGSDGHGASMSYEGQYRRLINSVIGMASAIA